MSQPIEPEGLAPDPGVVEQSEPGAEPLAPEVAALTDGILAVVRATERGEPAWMLDVRRAAARLAAQRAGAARTPHRDGEV